MRSIHSWLTEYSESHQTTFNQVTHWVCVPAIMLSLLGLLWSIQTPALLSTVSPLLNWAVIFVLSALFFYSLLSIPLALGMVAVTMIMLALVYWLDSLATPLWQLSVGIFVVAWIGQFVGHLVEGRRPSFFKDLQFLLIGPVWLLAKVYKRAGIKY